MNFGTFYFDFDDTLSYVCHLWLESMWVFRALFDVHLNDGLVSKKMSPMLRLNLFKILIRQSFFKIRPGNGKLGPTTAMPLIPHLMRKTFNWQTCALIQFTITLIFRSPAEIVLKRLGQSPTWRGKLLIAYMCALIFGSRVLLRSQKRQTQDHKSHTWSGNISLQICVPSWLALVCFFKKTKDKSRATNPTPGVETFNCDTAAGAKLWSALPLMGHIYKAPIFACFL